MLTMSKVTFLVKTVKTNVTLKWRIMDNQPKWGSDLGTLPGHIFMSSLKILYMGHPEHPHSSYTHVG